MAASAGPADMSAIDANLCRVEHGVVIDDEAAPRAVLGNADDEAHVALGRSRSDRVEQRLAFHFAALQVLHRRLQDAFARIRRLRPAQRAAIGARLAGG